MNILSDLYVSNQPPSQSRRREASGPEQSVLQNLNDNDSVSQNSSAKQPESPEKE